ncbi:MAG: ABC transporter permease [Thermoleophilaceae bacterium]
METLLHDLRYALRSLRKSPGFTAVVVLTLALGIGANTAIFSLVNAVLLRPLPFPEPDRLVQVWETRPGEDDRRVAPANFLDWRADSRVFEGLASYDVRTGNLLGGGEPERVTFATVSANFFQTLGVDVRRGRMFLSDESDASGTRTAILSHELWLRRFGGDPAVLGRTVKLDSQAFRIVGVMSDRFDFPSGTELWVRAPFDVPGLAGFPGDITQLRDAWYFRVVGRLAEGIDLAEAQTGMDVLARRLETEYPVANLDAGIRLVPLHEELVGDTRAALVMLLAAVGLVMLIACVNVANLVLARATRRRKELALRTALGAARGRLAAQLLGESVILGLLGGGLGVLIAYGAAPLQSRLLPPGLLPPGGVQPDASLLGFALALSLVTALVFGALPAFYAARVAPGAALGERGSGGGGLAGRRVRGALVVAECAFAVLLVLGASLALKSSWRLQQVDPGYRVEGLQTMRIALPGVQASEAGQAASFYGDVLARVGALPRVTSAAVAMSGPADDGPGAGLRIEDRPAPEGALPDASWQVVSPDYFRTAGIPLLRGRTFEEQDDGSALPVAVINEALARRHWPGGDAIGRRINTGLDGEGVWVTVVGVVGSTKNEGLAVESAPEMFRPLAQPSRGFGGAEAMLLVRSDAAAATPLSAIRAAIREVRPDVPVFDIRTGRELLGGSVVEPRTILLLLGTFAGLALILGAVGIYGVLSYVVGQRTQEIGVRIALGARGSEVMLTIVRTSLALVAGGLALGLVAALLATRVLEGLLFQVSTTDPVMYAAAALVLLAVGLGASVVPARRAARVDPMVALRNE